MEKTENIFVIGGQGLGGPRDLPVELVDVLRGLDRVYIETYTNFVDERVEAYEHYLGIPVRPVTRDNLETRSKAFLIAQQGRRSGLLISGDPFLATTHHMLWLEALQLGLRVEVYHNVSVFTAVPSLTGLSAYKFGKTVTLPFPERILSETPYDVVKTNLASNAHTLVLLDIDVPAGHFVPVSTAIDRLLNIEDNRSEGVVSLQTRAVGMARIGRPDQQIHAGSLAELRQLPWESFGPPQSLVVCGPLQVAEEEFLDAIWSSDGSHPQVRTRPTTILVTGTFDILHPGHIAFFRNAKELRTPAHLWVVVARDSSVQSFKGRPPILPQEVRLEMVQSLRLVDGVFLGNDGEDKIKIVEELRPDIVVLGYDQWIDEDKLQAELRRRGLDQTQVHRLPKYGKDGYSSSTDIRRKIERQRKPPATAN